MCIFLYASPISVKSFVFKGVAEVRDRIGSRWNTSRAGRGTALPVPEVWVARATGSVLCSQPQAASSALRMALGRMEGLDAREPYKRHSFLSTPGRKPS